MPPAPGTAAHPLSPAGDGAPQSPLVEGVGDEAAHVGVHPVGDVEQDPPLDGHGGVAVEEVLEGGAAGAHRVGALRRLGQLLRVAQEDDVVRRRAHGHQVGERHLPGLVDHEHVDGADHGVAGEEPRRAGHDVDRPGGARFSAALSWAQMGRNSGRPPSMVVTPKRYSRPSSAAKGSPSMSKKTSPADGGGRRQRPSPSSTGSTSS